MHFIISLTYQRSNNEGYPFGIGTNIYLIGLIYGGYALGHVSANLMVWNSNINEGNNVLMEFQNTDPDDNYSKTLRFREIAYVRPILNQYGWNTYDARSKQQNISTNYYQPIGSIY